MTEMVMTATRAALTKRGNTGERAGLVGKKSTSQVCSANSG